VSGIRVKIVVEMTAETKTLKMGRVRKRGVTVPVPPHQTLPPIQTQIPPQAVRHLVKEAGAVPIVAKPSKPTVLIIFIPLLQTIYVLQRVDFMMRFKTCSKSSTEKKFEMFLL